MLSRTVSELSQLTVQILDTLCFEPPLGLRENVRCLSWAHWKAYGIKSRQVFLHDFLLVLIELLSLGVTAERK